MKFAFMFGSSCIHMYIFLGFLDMPALFLTFYLPDRRILYLSRFIKVETLIQGILRNNEETYWVPDFVKV